MRNHMETTTLKSPQIKKVHRFGGQPPRLDKSYQSGRFWLLPWGYTQTTVITGTLLLIGFLLEILSGSQGIIMASWPINLGLLIGFIGLLIILAVYSKKKALIASLASIPSAICFIGAVGVLSLIAGIIPQDLAVGGELVRKLGLNHIVSSWPFAFGIFLLLSNLGIATIRKLIPFQRQNIRFILNHAGLWIIIAAGAFGSSDMQRLIMFANEEEVVQRAYYDENKTVEMPFSVYLKDFKIEEFPPTLTFIDARTGEILFKKADPIVEVQPGSKVKLNGWRLEVLRFFPSASKIENIFEPSKIEGAAPAALIKAVNAQTEAVRTGWISCGSYSVQPVALELESALLVMTIPRPKKFQSEVILTTKDGIKRHAILEVNKPINIAGWKLYQISYDEKLGKWSKLSVIEAVRDPWLPVVYGGIFMLLTGTLYMLWEGTKVKGVNAS